MPGQTPNYGIRYPCPGDPINPVDFANWAFDIEQAVNEVDLAAQAALLRPRAMLRTSTAGSSVPVGVSTTIVYNEVVYNEGLEVGAGPTFTTFLPEGTSPSMLMLLTATFIPVNTGTTVTSFEGKIVTNNVTIGRTLASSVASTIAKPITVIAVGHVESVFGTTASFHWTGTGGPLLVYSQFSCSYIALSFP